MIFILIILIGYVIWRNLPRENKRVIAKGIINTTEQSASLVNTSISKAKKSVEKSLSKSYLTSCSWVLNNELGNNILYTFLNNNELLITTNGSVKKGSYQLIVDNNSILITLDGLILHYNIVNIKNDFLYLNKIASNEVLVFFNNTKIKDKLKQNAKNDYNKILAYENDIELAEKEMEFIKSDYDVMMMAFSSKRVWEAQYPNKNYYFDYIAFLEGKEVHDDVLFDEWRKKTNGKNRFDYLLYLQYHKVIKNQLK